MTGLGTIRLYDERIYLQAAARLYLSLKNGSRIEFDAVARRLARSARTFAMGPTSTNHHQVVGQALLR